MADELAGRAHQRPGVDAGVLPEPAVFVVQQCLQVERRHRVRRRGIAPHPVAVSEGAQRRAVARDDQRAGVANLGEWWRECKVQHQQADKYGHRRPSQPGRPTSRLRPVFPAHAGIHLVFSPTHHHGLNHRGSTWIPAFAGMTMVAEKPFALPHSSSQRTLESGSILLHTFMADGAEDQDGSRRSPG